MPSVGKRSWAILFLFAPGALLGVCRAVGEWEICGLAAVQQQVLLPMCLVPLPSELSPLRTTAGRLSDCSVTSHFLHPRVGGRWSGVAE